MQPTLRVLVVEDSAMIAMLLAQAIGDLGHSVCAVAATEAAAVEQAFVSEPDLMIVDAGLGGGSGLSAVDKILETRFVPHLFVTGDVQRVRALRPDAIILEKPFSILNLACAIEHIALAAAASPLPQVSLNLGFNNPSK